MAQQIFLVRHSCVLEQQWNNRYVMFEGGFNLESNPIAGIVDPTDMIGDRPRTRTPGVVRTAPPTPNNAESTPDQPGPDHPAQVMPPGRRREIVELVQIGEGKDKHGFVTTIRRRASGTQLDQR